MSCSRSKEDESSSFPPKKWICKACTFENWPRAVKCTICCQPQNTTLIIGDHGHKSEKDIEREERRQRDRQRDIYKMASLIIEKKDSGHSDVNLKNSVFTDNPNNKWQCPRCTYLNWPKAAKCTQCLTQLRRSSPSASMGSLSEVQTRGDSPSHHDNHNEKLSSIAQAARPSGDSYQSSSPVGTAEKWWAPGSSLQKWACAACTYENWPKANKCVLCLTSRGQQPLLDSPQSIERNIFNANTSSKSNTSSTAVKGAARPESPRAGNTSPPAIESATPVRSASDNRHDATDDGEREDFERRQSF